MRESLELPWGLGTWGGSKNTQGACEGQEEEEPEKGLLHCTVVALSASPRLDTTVSPPGSLQIKVILTS